MRGIKLFFRMLYNKFMTVHVRKKQVYYMKFRFLVVSPSCCFGGIALQTFHGFINCEEFYECCDKIFVRSDDRLM